jgi:DNA invertase Pin-like site-specific DNA recombinase
MGKLVGYLRVKTDRQAEAGFGLGVQEKAIRGWAEANGHRVVLWCRDEGVSGSNGGRTATACRTRSRRFVMAVRLAW